MRERNIVWRLARDEMSSNEVMGLEPQFSKLHHLRSPTLLRLLEMQVRSNGDNLLKSEVVFSGCTIQGRGRLEELLEESPQNAQNRRRHHPHIVSVRSRLRPMALFS